MLVLSLKKLARDVFDNFATHGGLVYEVTDTDRSERKKKGEKKKKKQYPLSCFRDFQTLIFNEQDDKSSRKLLCVFV